MPSAQKYEEKTLVDRCWKVIDEQTEAAVKSDSFATMDKSLLVAVVERDTLNIAMPKLSCSKESTNGPKRNRESEAYWQMDKKKEEQSENG